MILVTNIMPGKRRTALLLFFVVYLLFSVLAVAYDYHNPSETKFCPLCFMRGSLSSTMVEACFVPPIDDQPIWHGLRECKEPFGSLDCTIFVWYRGPPEELLRNISHT